MKGVVFISCLNAQPVQCENIPTSGERLELAVHVTRTLVTPIL